MTSVELWRFACGLRDGHVRIAGPWKRWQPDTAQSLVVERGQALTGQPLLVDDGGMYRPTWNGGVAVRTDHSVDQNGGTPTLWAEGSAGLWQPVGFSSVLGALGAADAFLTRSGWILCDDESL